MASRDALDDTAVVHSTPIWLPRTQTWLFNQIRFLPGDIEPHIVCEKTANLDVFKLPNTNCLADEPWVRRSLDRVGRKLGFRRHLNLLSRVVEHSGAEIIHSHFAPTGWRNMGAATETNARHVVSVYGADVTQAPRSNLAGREHYDTLFRDIDAVFCEGHAMADRVVGLGCAREKVIVHHLGVDLDLLPFRPRKWAPSSPFRVLIAATFREKKGIPYAIQALARLRNRADVELTIIGDATGKPGDEKEKARIISTLEETGLDGRTKLMGFQPHAVLIDEAYRHHVFLSPSVTAADGDAEGGAPVSIIEMAASGMPIVSSLHCDIPEIVINGQTGWLAPERDPDAVAAHLEWLIGHPNEWTPYLEAGRRHIEEDYNCRVQGERLAHHYRRLGRARFATVG